MFDTYCKVRLGDIDTLYIILFKPHQTLANLILGFEIQLTLKPSGIFHYAPLTSRIDMDRIWLYNFTL